MMVVRMDISLYNLVINPSKKAASAKTGIRPIIILTPSLAPCLNAAILLMVPGNKNAKEVALRIQQQGLDVRPILSPTVPKGKERIRICLHSFNTEEEVIKLAQTINSL